MKQRQHRVIRDVYARKGCLEYMAVVGARKVDLVPIGIPLPQLLREAHHDVLPLDSVGVARHGRVQLPVDVGLYRRKLHKGHKGLVPGGALGVLGHGERRRIYVVLLDNGRATKCQRQARVGHEDVPEEAAHRFGLGERQVVESVSAVIAQGEAVLGRGGDEVPLQHLLAP